MDKVIDFIKAIKWKYVYIIILMLLILAVVGYMLYGLVMIIQSRRAIAEVELPDLDADDKEENKDESVFSPPEEFVVEFVEPEEEVDPAFKTDEEKLKKNEEIFYEQLAIEGKRHIIHPSQEAELPEVSEIDTDEAIKEIDEAEVKEDKTSTEKEYNTNDMAHIVKSELVEDEFSELVEDILSDDVIDDFDYQSVKRDTKRDYENEVIEDSSFDDMLEDILLDDEENV